jgi:putative tricarboxylic transport membrane protein
MTLSLIPSLTRRAAIASALALAIAAPAAAQTAPEGPIEFTVGAGAGGTPDVIMRTLAKVMNETGAVSNPIVVQNRTGGGHSNAYNHVLGMPGDRNTLLTLASPVFTTPIVQGTPSVIDQITPIASIVATELMLVVRPSSPHQTLADFVAAAKANPGRTRIAGGSAGGNDHLLTALLEQKAGVDMTYIPHESGSAGRATFLGDNVEGLFATLAEGMEMIASGDARPLAIFSEARRTEDGVKDIPTAREQGVDMIYTQFWGVGGPAEMDPALAQWWAEKFEQALTSPEWKAYVAENMMLENFRARDDAGAYFTEQQTIFRELLTAVGLAKG